MLSLIKYFIISSLAPISFIATKASKEIERFVGIISSNLISFNSFFGVEPGDKFLLLNLFFFDDECSIFVGYCSFETILGGLACMIS